VRNPVFPAFFLGCLLFVACGSSPKEKPPRGDSSGHREPPRPNTERTLVEQGSPASLARVAPLLEEDISDQGGSLRAAASIIARLVYPDIPLELPQVSGGHAYERVIRDIERGTYTAPPSDSADFLELVLPFLALYTGGDSNTARYQSALSHLEQAARLNKDSVLPPLFRGIAYEKTESPNEAETAYKQALELDNSCYPAEFGLARLLHAQGKLDEAFTQLKGLQGRYPGSLEIRKQLARLHAQRSDWQEADALTAEILRAESRNGEFILLRALVLLERGLFQQAQGLLDTYASIDRNNRRYIFLRARLQAEGLRNPSAAINLLRPLNRSDPADPEVGMYLASLLLDSSRAADVEEGRGLLARFLGSSSVVPEALSLAAADNIRRENWPEAKNLLDRLLAVRRERKDLLNAWKVERALGNYTAALAHARELYGRTGANSEETAAYITSLIDTGRQADAGRIIDERLGSLPSGAEKSRYYFLRSLLRSSEDAVLNDLRSALFEDPRNLDALIAIFEKYHRKRDERRAVYYLRQALAIAPDNPQLMRYKMEYGSLLGN